MKNPGLILCAFLGLFTLNIYSQNNFQKFGGSISGKVIDSATKEPIQYVNVILFSNKDSLQTDQKNKESAGTITDNKGLFEITPVRPGSYYVEIQFISYLKKRVDNIQLERGKMKIDLGTIEIESSSLKMGEAVVQEERSAISYQIDKKVIDVDKMNTTISGNAADVLQNVPSVTVDVDGNVSLRGSTNFSVLIDGKRSIVDPQDVLQQIPANSIANIEIITNPSAKYDPEGNAGIINIILKKSNIAGMSGITNVVAGFKEKFGGNITAQYKTDLVSANFGLDYNNMSFPGTGNSKTITTFNGNSSDISSTGTGTWSRKMFGIRGGLDFNLGQSDQLSLSGRYGKRDMQRNSYEDYTVNDELSQLFYQNSNRSKRGGNNYSLSTNFKHEFEQGGHELLSEFSFRHNNSEEDSYTELFDNNLLINGIHTTENGPENEIEGKIDYTLPLGTSKFEAGYDGQIEISNDNVGYYQTNPDGVYEYFPQFSHLSKSDKREHALYSLYSFEFGALGLQGGLRVENTYRNISLDVNYVNIDTWDLFPTLHSSFSLGNGDQIMASYTRRIQRPRDWFLEPFETWTDANNVRRGNPSLNPEYIDSYEGGFKTTFGDISLSTELYYRINHGKIENIKSAYAENVTLTTFENVGADYSLGTEIMMNFGLGKFWDANLMGKIYDYRIKGTLYNEPFSRKSFNWNSRFNNTFRFTSTTQLQFTFFYNSPTVSSQGKNEGFFSTDAALKQDLFEKSLSLTLQVRDLFSTAKYEFTSTGPDIYSYHYMKRDSPVIMLNIRYNINNFKNDEDRRRPQQDNNDAPQEGEL